MCFVYLIIWKRVGYWEQWIAFFKKSIGKGLFFVDYIMIVSLFMYDVVFLASSVGVGGDSLGVYVARDIL
jgi:hypothetical protein